MVGKVTAKVAKNKTAIPESATGLAPYAVVACTDKAQLPFACMAVVSANHYLDGLKAALYVVAQGCGAEELEQAVALCKDHGADVTLIPFDERANMGHGSFRNGHISDGMFLRLYLDDLLPRHFEKVLYLDTDTMVVDSLRPFLQMDLGDNLFAAHADRFLELRRKEHLSDYIDINKLGCFNSGVMLFNWPKVLREDFLKKTLALRVKPGFKYPDQDMLNVAANGNWYAMDGKFNASRYVISAGEKPVIMHFVSLEKPWGANYYIRQLKYRRPYQAFVKGTPWENYIKPKTPVGWAIVAWEPVMWWQQRKVGRQWQAMDRERARAAR